jgi:hypothetical protein
MSVKYEVYLNAYASVAEAKAGIASWLGFSIKSAQHLPSTPHPSPCFSASLAHGGRRSAPSRVAVPPYQIGRAPLGFSP